MELTTSVMIVGIQVVVVGAEISLNGSSTKSELVHPKIQHQTIICTLSQCMWKISHTILPRYRVGKNR